MPAGLEFSHGQATNRRTAEQRNRAATLTSGTPIRPVGGEPQALPRLLLLPALLLATVPLLAAPPARADLLAPLLGLLRPQVERRLAERCEGWLSGGDPQLAASLRQPCRRLAGPASRCLVEETSRSGRSLGVASELLAGRIGSDGEVVVKRCLARQVGLPPDALLAVPLRNLERRFSGRRPEMPGPAELKPVDPGVSGGSEPQP